MFKQITMAAILLLALGFTNIFSQKILVNKIEPPNWWAGMEHDTVQLMIYGKNLNLVKVESNDLKIVNFHNVPNHNYAFINIAVSSKAKIGNHTLLLSNSNDQTKISYPILLRKRKSSEHIGFSNRDVIYLIMPDRFANEDTTNDKINGYDDSFKGNPTQGRRGGDIKGIIKRLNYLKDLGITAIWLTPLLENNTDRSYHGYAATDLYKIDPRFGTLADYKHLVKKAHELGLKIIYDHVSNHISIDHPWMKDLPTKTWINGTEKKHLNAVHNKMVFTDPHSDSLSIKKITQGWFVDIMPDLNQKDKYLANYLIQNLIWWMETAEIDGVREDTYPYADANFEARLSTEILREYPASNIVGEVWTGEPAYLAGFQKDSKVRESFNTNLPVVTDFAMRDAFYHFLKGGSIFEIYSTLAKDNLYPNPDNLLVFIDNHDIERTMFIADKNLKQAKLAYLMLLTTRGIPQILYGSEIGMVGTQDQGTLRLPFPGGFPNDKRDAFTFSGRTEYENNIFNFLKKIFHLRKKHSALSVGKLTQFPPKNEIYVYTKQSDNEKILVLVNNGKKAKTINLKNYFPTVEKLSYINLMSKQTKTLIDNMNIDIKKKNFLLLKIN